MTDKERNQAIIDALSLSYRLELETVMNYIALSTNMDGIRAKHIKDELAADIATELAHAQIIARRIKTIGGQVPSSMDMTWTQAFLQTPDDTTDVKTVVEGVIQAEEAAIASYKAVIELASGFDPATEDMAVTALADEEEHRREFKGFLKELEMGRL